MFSFQVQGQFKIILNFDDAYKGIFDNAFPLMEKYKLPGVVFVPTKFVGAQDHLNLEQLKKLKQAGWEIGSHTVHHPNLDELTPDGLRNELSESKLFLINNNLVDNDYVSFCSPGAVWNKEIAVLASTNYQIARTRELFDFRKQKPLRTTCKVILDKTDTYSIEKWIKQAATEKIPIILIFHEIGKGPNGYYFSRTKFEKIINFINNNYQQEVITFRSLYDYN